MKITIIAVGKLKEKFYRQAVDEYVMRLSKYCRIDIIETPDEKTPDHAGHAIEEQIKTMEAEKVMRYIKNDTYVIALALQGKMMDSVELSNEIESLGIQGTSHIVFVIGGSLGLSETVLKRANALLSFSKMTFPHQLMRVILLEQIYRSFKIMKKEPYHK